MADVLWETVPGLTDADMTRLAEAIAPRVIAGQVLIANLTAAEIARELGVAPALVARELVTGGRGVPPLQVYARPLVAARAAVAAGKPFAAAMTTGRQRLRKTVATDLQMAKVRQADASLKDSGARYFRRVLRGSENCAMCVIASTQRYHVGTLSPIHPGCDCDVEAIEGSAKLPQVIDSALLQDAHGAVKALTGVADRGGRAVDYRKLILVRNHGEIGPVLTWRDQGFTGPRDLAA